MNGFRENPFKKGSFVYHSGTHPQVQVQMGLYGAIARNNSPTSAYAGESFHNVTSLFYSEIDVELHTAVATPGGYGPAGSLMTSTVDYQPEWFLVNGEPFDEGSTQDISGLVPFERNLVRFYNAGLTTRMATLDGGYLRLIAEDGQQYPFRREEFGAQVPPLKAVDAVMVNPDAGRHAVIDRTLSIGALRFLGIQDDVKIVRTRHGQLVHCESGPHQQVLLRTELRTLP